MSRTKGDILLGLGLSRKLDLLNHGYHGGGASDYQRYIGQRLHI